MEQFVSLPVCKWPCLKEPSYWNSVMLQKTSKSRPPEFIMLSPFPPHVTDMGSLRPWSGLNEVIRVELGAANRMGALIRRGRKARIFFGSWGHSQKEAVFRPGSVLNRRRPVGTLNLDLSMPKLWEKTFLWFKPPILWYFVMLAWLIWCGDMLEQTKTSPMNDTEQILSVKVLVFLANSS